MTEMKFFLSFISIDLSVRLSFNLSELAGADYIKPVTARRRLAWPVRLL
jgi:hypothetical protein